MKKAKRTPEKTTIFKLSEKLRKIFINTNSLL